jgi:uncharacterized protein YdcH (DUF465 family)
MNLHISSLLKKHRELDHRIKIEESNVGRNSIHLSEMKKMKLKIKDRIASLKQA